MPTVQVEGLAGSASRPRPLRGLTLAALGGARLPGVAASSPTGSPRGPAPRSLRSLGPRCARAARALRRRRRSSAPVMPTVQVEGLAGSASRPRPLRGLTLAALGGARLPGVAASSPTGSPLGPAPRSLRSLCPRCARAARALRRRRRSSAPVMPTFRRRARKLAPAGELREEQRRPGGGVNRRKPFFSSLLSLSIENRAVPPKYLRARSLFASTSSELERAEDSTSRPYEPPPEPHHRTPDTL